LAVVINWCLHESGRTLPEFDVEWKCRVRCGRFLIMSGVKQNNTDQERYDFVWRAAEPYMAKNQLAKTRVALKLHLI